MARVDVASLRAVTAPPHAVERFLATVRSGRYVFAGPGSPSFALRVWADLPIGLALQGVLAEGGTVCLASAAALASGVKTLPVYEIYKVGLDPHWLDGLGLLPAVGLPLTVVSHWNNAEGGGHDTSRCYIGKRRFEELRVRLDHGVLGIDEHTAVTIDVSSRTLSVSGAGTSTILGADSASIPSGESVGFEDVLEITGAPAPAATVREASRRFVDLKAALGSRDADSMLAAILDLEDRAAAAPEGRVALRAALVGLVDLARTGLGDPVETLGPVVEVALRLREASRLAGRYERADQLRASLAALGIAIRDTSDGTRWSYHGGRSVAAGS